MQFNTWIKEVRLNKGLTQRAFAKETEITYVSICNFESGKRFPAIKSINKLSHYTSVSVEKIRRLIKTQQSTKKGGR